MTNCGGSAFTIDVLSSQTCIHHTANMTAIQILGRNLIPHPPYYPDPASSNFHRHQTVLRNVSFYNVSIFRSWLNEYFESTTEGSKNLLRGRRNTFLVNFSSSVKVCNDSCTNQIGNQMKKIQRQGAPQILEWNQHTLGLTIENSIFRHTSYVDESLMGFEKAGAN